MQLVLSFMVTGSADYLSFNNIRGVVCSSGWEAEIKWVNIHAQPVCLSTLNNRGGERATGREGV